jgi:alpha-mannosidase
MKRIFFQILIFLLFSQISFPDRYLDYSGFEMELKYIKVDSENKELIQKAEEILKEIKYGEKIVEIDKKDYFLRIEILRKALSKIDLKALRNNEREKFLNSLEEARKILKPIKEVAKSYKIYLIGYSHIDTAWKWPWRETVEVMKDTSNIVLNFMNEYPDFIFTQSAAQHYLWMEEYYPEVFQKIKEKIKERRWDVVGGMWVEPDCNLPGGESFIRQILYGKRYFKDRFGIEIKVGWVPDSFGYNWNLPQILKKSGIDYFLTQKINWNDTTKFPYNIFWWQAPDGTKVLTYFPVGGYGEDVNPDVMLDQLKRIKEKHNINELLVIFGVGDHGGGITRGMLERAFKLKNTEIYPEIVFISSEKFFEKLNEFAKNNKVPTVSDELYLQYHRGTYTTQAKTKLNNRKSEILLENVEKFSTIAQQFGFIYPKDEIRELWRLILFNQFHDILPGSSIAQVYRDSEKDYEKIFKKGNEILNNAIDVISKNINTEGKGKPLIIYNPLSWERDGVLEIEVDNSENIRILDEKGKEISYQKIDKNKIFFKTNKIPSLGYAVYRIVPQKSNLREKEEIFVSDTQLENKFYKIKIDKNTGNIISIFDKEEKKEILKEEGGNILQLMEDNPEEYDAWNIGTGRIFNVELENIEVIESGPLRGILKITKKYEDQKFEQEIIIYKDIKRIDFKLKTFWKLRHYILKVAFNFNIKGDFVTSEIPYANIKRKTNPKNPQEWAKWELYAHKWIDYTENDSSYGVSILGDSKYGFDAKGNLIRITLLRGPLYPDMRADKSYHEIFYSIYSHRGDYRTAHTVKKGYEINSPLLIKSEGIHKGKLPPFWSFFKISQENVILSCLKKAEDTNSIILRIYEIDGKPANLEINLPFSPKQLYEVDFLERNIKKIKFKENKIYTNLGKYEIKTLKVENF